MELLKIDWEFTSTKSDPKSYRFIIAKMKDMSRSKISIISRNWMHYTLSDDLMLINLKEKIISTELFSKHAMLTTGDGIISTGSKEFFISGYDTWRDFFIYKQSKNEPEFFSERYSKCLNILEEDGWLDEYTRH